MNKSVLSSKKLPRHLVDQHSLLSMRASHIPVMCKLGIKQNLLDYSPALMCGADAHKTLLCFCHEFTSTDALLDRVQPPPAK